MEKTNWSEHVIVVHAGYADEVAGNLTRYYQQELQRPIPPADLAHWLVCVALDGGLTAGNHQIHVVFVHDKDSRNLAFFRPSSFAEELDGKSFDDPELGTFSLSCVRDESPVPETDLFSQVFETLADAREVKNLIVVAGGPDTVAMMNGVMDRTDTDKRITLLTMQPAESKYFRTDILGYSLTSALGVRGEEFK